MLRTRTIVAAAAAVTMVMGAAVGAMSSTASANTRTWTGNASTLSWHDAGNWDPIGVPGPADDVVINLAGPEITYSTGTTTINSLVSNRDLAFTGGGLAVTTTATTTGAVTIQGGGLDGGLWDVTVGGIEAVGNQAANRLVGVTVVGQINLLSQSARIRIEGGTTFDTALLAHNSTQILFAPGSVLTGSILFGGAVTGQRNVSMNTNAGTLTIAPGGEMRTLPDLGANVQIGNPAGSFGAMTLINNGSIVSETATRTVTIQPLNLANNGTVAVANGATLTVNATNWSSPGMIDVDSATANLNGNFDGTDGNVGPIVNDGGTVNIGGTWNNAGSTITLDANSGTWRLAGGTISGGTLNLLPGSDFTSNTLNTNWLIGVEVLGDLMLSINGSRLRLDGGTTFETAIVAMGNAVLGLEPGSTIDGTIVYAGAGTGTRTVNMNGTSGTITLAPSAEIVMAPGFGGGATLGGTFGFGGTMTLINEGLIEAGVNNRTLNINPGTFTNFGEVSAVSGGIVAVGSGDWSNEGTFSVDSATLNLGGTFNATGGVGTFVNDNGSVNITGTLNNTASTLLLDGGTGSWTLNGGTISGGQLSFARGATLAPTASTTNILNGVQVNGDLSLSVTNARLRIEGGTSFDNAFITGSGATLGFAPGSTLFGQVIIGGSGGGSRFVTVNGTSGTVTIAPGSSIRTASDLGGNATIGSGGFSGTMTLINDGLIGAETNGRTVTMQTAGGFTNNGTAQALNGGTLTINPPNWSNAGLVTVTNSTINCQGNWSNGGDFVVNGGTLNLDGSFTTAGIGSLTNNGGQIVIKGNLDNTGDSITLDAATGSWLLDSGTILGGSVNPVGATTLKFSAATQNILRDVAFNGEILLDSTNGRIRIEGSTSFPSAVITGSGATLGFEPGSVISVPILFGGSTSGSRFFTVNGTSGTVTIGPTGELRTAPGFGGTAFVGTGGFSGNMTLVNQGLISSEVATRNIQIAAASFTNQGVASASGGGVLSVNNTVDFTNLSGSTLTDGTWRAANGGTMSFINDPPVDTLSGNASVILDGPGTFASINPLRTVNAGSSFSLLGGRNFNAMPGGQPFANAGTVSLGLDSVLTVNGAYTQSATGSVAVTVDSKVGPAPVSASGAVTVAGNLTLAFENAFVPTLGNTTTVIDGMSVMGTFSSVTHPLMRSCLIDAFYTPSTVQFGIEQTPPAAVCAEITVQVGAGGEVTITPEDIGADSTDNCAIAFMEIAPSSFTCANVGTNLVTLTVTDLAGNVSQCVAVVTVEYTGEPIGTPGGSWFDPDNWCLGVPSSTSSVTLSQAMVVDGLGAEVGALQIGAGGELTVGAAGGASLTAFEQISIGTGGALAIGTEGTVIAPSVVVGAGGTLALTSESAHLIVDDLVLLAGATLEWSAGTIEIRGVLTGDGAVEVGCSGMVATLIVDDGVVTVPTLELCVDGRLFGDGVVAATLVNGGLVAPGLSPGTITVDGDYVQSASGELRIEALGTAPGTEHDRLVVSGTATLDGLLSLIPIGGFEPTLLDAFTVITAGDVVGTPNAVDTPSVVEPLFWDLQISASAVTLKLRRLGDLNDDTFVDGADLGILLNLWGSDDPNADLNGDGIVDGADLGILLNNWG